MVKPLSDLAGIGGVLGVLESHRLEDDEPLRVPAALPDSSEFHSQRLDKAVPDSPAWRIVLTCGHHRQGSSPGLPLLVSLDPPTEVCSIVGVYPVPIYLLDPLVLPHGHVPQKIPHGPLPVLRLILRLLHHFHRCCIRVL